MRIAAQLYTVRQLGDLAAQLDLVRACGFVDVETIGFHDLPPQQMAQQVAQSGLTVRSAHFDWEEFETRFDDILTLLDLLNCPVAVMPWLAPQTRPVTVTEWQGVADQLSCWAARLARRGVRLAYHNHDFDLVGRIGERPLDLILAHGALYWQPDIGGWPSRCRTRPRCCSGMPGGSSRYMPRMRIQLRGRAMIGGAIWGRAWWIGPSCCAF